MGKKYWEVEYFIQTVKLFTALTLAAQKRFSTADFMKFIEVFFVCLLLLGNLNLALNHVRSPSDENHLSLE